MYTFFLICFAIGGTVLFCQLAVSLLGMAGHSMDMDSGHDLGGGGHDFGADAGHHFGGDGHAAADHAADHPAGEHPGHAAQTPAHHAASWVAGVISFRTVVAALAFFGLGGLAGESAGAAPTTVWAIALVAGAAAMYAVYWMMRGLYSLRCEGTVQIHRAVGREGTVYIPIPGKESGVGKVQLVLQNQIVEYAARTAGDPLPTGAKVVVVGLVSQNTVQVEPVPELERSTS